MPAAGSPDSKYVRKVHYARSEDMVWRRALTRCGKNMWARHTTQVPAEVTCLTCRKFLAYWADKEGQ
uniref:Uncharacterized protein n=1 Tax=viral metagenome TaxID=1070528 RepID=A0A6M3Y1T3_9ZZZZ